MKFEAFIFDMDGTILHSLPDLALAANEALRRMGFPTRSYDEIAGFMGKGSSHLVEMCCPPDAAPGQRERTFEAWRSIYLQSDYAHTAPFPGIVATLDELRRRGAKTAVLSNKFDAGVQLLSQRYFPGLFDAVRGEIPPTPRKPDPTSLLLTLAELDIAPDKAVYVGDTQVDVRTARNAGIPIIGVSWGYDASAPMPRDQLAAYLHHPEELLEYAL